MIELLQEPLKLFVTGIIGILTTVIIFVITELKNKVMTWLDSRTTNEQRDLLNKWCEEAFAYVETIYKDLKGKDKLDAAILYVSRQAKAKKIPLESYEIQAAIEKAILQYQKTNS